MRGRVTISAYGCAFVQCIENGAEYFITPAEIRSEATLVVGQRVEFETTFVLPIASTRAVDVRVIDD